MTRSGRRVRQPNARIVTARGRGSAISVHGGNTLLRDLVRAVRYGSEHQTDVLRWE